jgi:5-methylcytosine-specific restriction enzyme A
MSDHQSVDVMDVLVALMDLGGAADVGRIKDRVTKTLGGVPEHYKDENSFRNTIQRIIEDYCPQAEDYDATKPPLFSRVARGRYRVIPESDRSKFGFPPPAA